MRIVSFQPPFSKVGSGSGIFFRFISGQSQTGSATQRCWQILESDPYQKIFKVHITCGFLIGWLFGELGSSLRARGRIGVKFGIKLMLSGLSLDYHLIYHFSNAGIESRLG